jgi:predicted DNA-binding transcriptional regulator AlpA
MAQKSTTYHSKPALAQRYGVSSRSIDRWRLDGKFPKPDIILPSGQPRWRDDTIERHERRSVTNNAPALATETLTQRTSNAYRPTLPIKISARRRS